MPGALVGIPSLQARKSLTGDHQGGNKEERGWVGWGSPGAGSTEGGEARFDVLTPLPQAALCSLHSAMRTKVYAILELWVQVCGASAGVLQGGASGEALLTHLLSDISPSADTLKVRLLLIVSSAKTLLLCPLSK